MARDQDQAARHREAVGERLRQRLAVGREVDDVVGRRAVGDQRLDAGEERLGLEHHPALPAERRVVDLPGAALGVVPEVVHADVEQALVLRAAQDGVLERAAD